MRHRTRRGITEVWRMYRQNKTGLEWICCILVPFGRHQRMMDKDNSHMVRGIEASSVKWRDVAGTADIWIGLEFFKP